MTEANLIVRSRNGDPDSWEALTRTHQEAVFRFAYLLLGDPDDAEDVTQEAFVRAYYALKRFDTSKPLRPWLMRITSNLARNRQRSLGRYLNAVTRFGREAGQAEEPLPRDDAQTLWKAIRQLKLEFQQVLYLRFFLDMSESEIAQAADLPAGTVKSRLHRAVAALREVIEQDYPHLKMTFNA